MSNNRTYEEYLAEQGYSKNTISTYLTASEKFIGWCSFKGHNSKHIDYKTCLEYVKDLQRPRNNKIIAKTTVQSHVGALKIYFNFLVEESHGDNNPMQNINIKGVRRTLNHSLLEFEELEDLFYSFPTQNIKKPNCPHVAIRNKVIVSLMVYQGLDSHALMSLKFEHIHINKMRIYIPRTRKTNARELELKAPQMRSLVQFLEQDRLMLQNKISCHTAALFPCNSERSSILMSSLFKRLKKLNYRVKDCKQIRASVITYWLKLHNIRKAQYMIGHRYISSTERYLQHDIENLQEVISMAHPIS